jgi:hypothetical protein
MDLRTRSAILGILLATAACGQAADPYRVKAAFLYNFAKFVEWPADAFKSPAGPIVICVVGKNPFGDVLDEAIHGQAAQGKPFAVRQISDAAQMRTCHILFVSSSERKRLPSIFQEIKNCAVLTVGESDNFTAEGGIVNFRIEQGSIRLQINPDAATRQQLHISSKLLSLAEIVPKGTP